MADKDSKLCGKYSHKRQNKRPERWTEGQRGMEGCNRRKKVRKLEEQEPRRRREG